MITSSPAFGLDGQEGVASVSAWADVSSGGLTNLPSGRDQSNGPLVRGVHRRLQQSGCSATDASPEAVLACINAVRTNPDILSNVSCYSSIQASLKSPQRKALAANAVLTAVAADHNARMIAAQQLSAQLPGEATFGSRVLAAGYSYSVLTSIMGWGSAGALGTVSTWLCSTSERVYMFACDITDVGTATGSKYFTQVFGCQMGTSCNSCVSSGSNTSSPSPSPSPSPGPSPTPSPILSPSPSPSPRPSPSPSPSPSTNPCLKNDSSPAAILACINAVRANPDIMAGVPCYASIQAALKTPRRGPLATNALLAASALDHNMRHILANQLVATLPGEADLGNRTLSYGYPYSFVAMNLAAGLNNAYDIVATWMCSDGQRQNMFACNIKDTGIATGIFPDRPVYVTQVFACPSGQTCDSCAGNGTSATGNSTTGGSGSTGNATVADNGPCSSTNATAAAVLECINAVRQNVSILSDAPCYASVKASMGSPQRYALAQNTALTAVAAEHTALMVAQNSLNTQFPGELPLGSQAVAKGYNYSSISLNVAYGSMSARAVVSAWMCFDGMRTEMFSCGVRDFGAAVGSSGTMGLYFTQVFGCPLSVACNSCSNGTGGSGTGGNGSMTYSPPVPSLLPPSPRPRSPSPPVPVASPTPSPVWTPPPTLSPPANNPGNSTLQWLDIRPLSVPGKTMCVTIRQAQTGNGVPLLQQPCNKRQAQKFRLVAVGGYWSIVDDWDRCITAAAGNAKLVVSQCDGSSSVQFSLEAVAGQASVYRLRPRSTGKCVGVKGGTAAGANFVQEACSGAKDQSLLMGAF